MLTLAALKIVTVLKMTALTPDHCWKTMVAKHKMNGCQTAFVFISEMKESGMLEKLGNVSETLFYLGNINTKRAIFSK